jgi:hypothetical protein
MSAEAIFLPMLATMTLTAVVWFYMYALRIPAMYKAGVKAQTYTTPDKVVEHLPEEVNYSANNLKNLFELPVLFYGLYLYIFLSANVDTAYVVAALALWFMLGRALFTELAVYH